MKNISSDKMTERKNNETIEVKDIEGLEICPKCGGSGLE